MGEHFERVRFYLQRDRLAEAEAEIRAWLGVAADDPFAHAMHAELRMAQRRFPDALDAAEVAIGYAPNEPFLLYLLARSQFFNQQTKAARATIAEGLVQDPTDEDFHLLAAHIDVHEDRWADALTQIDQGLALAPAHVQLLNLRAQVLLKLNRKAEARQSLDYALQEAPDNSYSHANMGWAAVEQDRYPDAVKHFQEALRLDPTNDFARNGLKEAIKAKNYLYRGVLKYFLWLGKLQERGRWAFIIGLYLIYRLALYLADTYPSLSYILYPVVAIYVLFAFSSWIAAPVSNLFLRLHPLGKHALDADEKRASAITGLLLLGSILSLIAFYFTDSDHLLYLGGLLGLLLIPIGGTFGTQEGGPARRKLWYYTGALVVVGVLGLVFIQQTLFLILFALGIFGFGWMANYVIGQEAKSFL